jgi:hypothetical protein
VHCEAVGVDAVGGGTVVCVGVPGFGAHHTCASIASGWLDLARGSLRAGTVRDCSQACTGMVGRARVASSEPTPPQKQKGGEGVVNSYLDEFCRVAIFFATIALVLHAWKYWRWW